MSSPKRLTFCLELGELPEKAATRAATLPEDVLLPPKDLPLPAAVLPLSAGQSIFGVAGARRGGRVMEGCRERQPSNSLSSS